MKALKCPTSGCGKENYLQLLYIYIYIKMLFYNGSRETSGRSLAIKIYIDEEIDPTES